MYLQIIYQREALQMPKMTRQKRFNWPVNKLMWDMALQKIRHASISYGHMEYKICAENYLQLLPYISYEQSDLYMLVTTKAFLVAITK